MTRRSFSLVLAAAPMVSFPDAGCSYSARLLLVHDLGDLAHHISAGSIGFRPVGIVVRAHLDFWPGTGFPRRWEAWLSDASGYRAVRVLADPSLVSPASGQAKPEALEIVRRISNQWLIG